MTDTNTEVEQVEEETSTPTELDLLKQRADTMGLKYHHKAGVAKLKTLLEKAAAPEQQAVEDDEVAPVKKPTKKAMAAEERALKKTAIARKASGKLVRVVVTQHNPNKQSWPGEVFTVSNNQVGTFRKYIPFGLDTGFYIPNIIYKHLIERECQVFYDKRSPDGMVSKKSKIIKELTVTLLDDLTPTELEELKTRQIISNATDE